MYVLSDWKMELGVCNFQDPFKWLLHQFYRLRYLEGVGEMRGQCGMWATQIPKSSDQVLGPSITAFRFVEHTSEFPGLFFRICSGLLAY